MQSRTNWRFYINESSCLALELKEMWLSHVTLPRIISAIAMTFLSAFSKLLERTNTTDATTAAWLVSFKMGNIHPIQEDPLAR